MLTPGRMNIRPGAQMPPLSAIAKQDEARDK
jgi:hypothetical protein